MGSDGNLVDSDTDTDGVQPNYVNISSDAARGSTDPDPDDTTTFGTYVYVEATEADGDDTQVTVHQVFGVNADKNIPATHFATAGEGTSHGVLYATDDNDIYIKNGERPAPCVTFRPEAGNPVRVVVYFTDSDKASIYDITPTLPTN